MATRGWVHDGGGDHALEPPGGSPPEHGNSHPLLIDRLGGPAMGLSVILTFITDSIGIFMFRVGDRLGWM